MAGSGEVKKNLESKKKRMNLETMEGDYLKVIADVRRCLLRLNEANQRTMDALCLDHNCL